MINMTSMHMKDIYVAIRDTFDAVERQIKELNEKKRRLSRIPNKLTEPELAEIVNVEEFQESEAANH